MNPALGIVVILICIAVWLLAFALYKPIGRFVSWVARKVTNSLFEKDEKR